MFTAILKLLDDLPTLLPSARADSRLEGLFESLKRAPNKDVAETLQTEIWEIWCATPDTTTRTLMQWGMTALAENRPQVAEQPFSPVATYHPESPQPWTNPP